MEINHRDLYYPPGGLLLWMIVFLELITFGAALIVMVLYSTQEPTIFHESRLKLNVTIGTTNTVILLTSGFFMANTVSALRLGKDVLARRFLISTLFFGFLFLLLKAAEYDAKIDAGLVMGSNTFFTFYWMLTAFHAVHVLVGIALLGFLLVGLSRRNSVHKIEDVEAIATFWHMCDLIWLLLFPIIYLLF